MSAGIAKATADNSAQIEFWNGRVGETWARYQERLDRAFTSFTDRLVAGAAPRPGERLIDVGCGCGDLALALAARVGPQGQVLGIDVSKPMLERAQQRAEGLLAGGHAPLSFLEADASLHDFPAAYDLLASRFGVMFFADPSAAFANLRRALKPGGRFAFLCWRELSANPWVALPLAQVADLPGGQQQSDPLAPGPFALADRQRTCRIFVEAGFADCVAVQVDGDVVLGRVGGGAEAQSGAVADALELSLRTGPVGAILREADDDLKQEVRRRITKFLGSIARDGAVTLPGSCWLYTGRNPA